MKKVNKIWTIVLVVCTAFILATFGTYAATGEDVITFVKEIIENHIYYIDDVEVDESDYNALVSTDATYEKTTVDIEHRVYTECVYRINGNVVTEKEYNDYLTNAGVKTEPKKVVVKGDEEIEITATDLTPMNCGSLGDYLTFTTSGDNVTSATIKSDKVVGVKYTYCDNYMASTSMTKDNYYFTETTFGVIYQDVDNGMTFKSGSAPKLNFYVADEDYNNTVAMTKGDVVFKFEYASNQAPITFNKVFSSITLILKKD